MTDEVGAVLEGVRVFDLTLAAVGPWSAKLLGQLGAEVFHVEGPDPELAHNIPPYLGGAGVLYVAANSNKRQVVLDLKDGGDRRRALDLAASCDVFIQNMRPGAVERLGLGYEEVARYRPDIVYVSASAYGRVGPMAGEAGVDPLLQAFCGWTSLTGAPGGPGELFRHYAHLDLTTSCMIVEAVLAALLVRRRRGHGQHIEIEMLTAALGLQANHLAEFLAGGPSPVPLGTASRTTAPHEAFRCLDGHWLAVGVEADDQWPRLCTAVGLDDLAADPGLRTTAGRLAARDRISASLTQRFATRPVAWWELCCRRHAVPHSRLYDFEALRHHPQARAVGQLAEVRTEIRTDRDGTLVVDGPPWRFGLTPAEPTRPPGAPGADNAAVLAGVPEAQPVSEPPVTADGAAPLAGTVVIEIAEGTAGPSAAARLADLGAEVIKVERLGGDPARGHGTPLPGTDGVTAAFAAINRGKRSVAVDLDDPAGIAVVHRLAAGADVVIEALAPAEADRLGLGHDALAAVNPEVVYVAVSGWGEDGPLAGVPAAELPVQAMAEYLSSLGRIGEPPVRLGADVAGLNTGIVACQAALAGLWVRERTGRGQRIAVSMLGTLLHLRGIMWHARSNPDDWYGFHLDHYTNPPETGYRTADGRVFFGLRRGNSEDFDQLMIALGLVDHLDDPRFADLGRAAAPLGRFAVEAKAVWESAFESMTTDEVIALLHARSGDAVPCTDLPTVTAHPQVAAIGALVTVPQEGHGAMRMVAPVWKFAATPAVVTTGAPVLGADGRAILLEAGVDPERVNELISQGVLGQR